MSFLSERSMFGEEMERHYAGYPSNLGALERELHDVSAQHPEWLPYTRKAAGYDLIAQRCVIKVFRHFPFCFEVDVGKPRTDLGSRGIGTWMKREPFGRELVASGTAWWKPCHESGLSLGWLVLDDNHHGLGYDNVFRYGLRGLIGRAEARLEKAETEKERAFLEAVIAGNRAVITLSGRFADEAERLLAEEQDPEVRLRLRRIADTARRVPAQPPATLYEALNTILFMREATQSIEGNGISVFGHLDRTLWPYYENDLKHGRLTREEAKDLLRFFLAFSDVRFGMRQVHNHVGTNTTEVNSRATIYLNLAHVLLMGFFPEKWSFFAEREGIQLDTYADCATFEDLYNIFLRNLKRVADTHIGQRNRTEKEGRRYNPCPLHSSTLDDCIEKALDMMEGGARYSFGSISLTGVGTLVDSLYAIRRVVHEQKRISLTRLKEILASNFQGEEAFRQYLIHRVPKFGQEDEGIRAFSSKVFADLARVSSGKPNTRGGRYEASLFSFRSFTSMGARTDATPDGRKAGEHLSPGMSPSPLALNKDSSVGQVLDALRPLDLCLYPVVAVLDVRLPASPGGCGPDVLAPVIRRFLDSGGSVLQVNYFSPEVLLEARQHPERHPDLVVRVSGFSAYFNTLSKEVQDEIVERVALRV